MLSFLQIAFVYFIGNSYTYLPSIEESHTAKFNYKTRPGTSSLTKTNYDFRYDAEYFDICKKAKTAEEEEEACPRVQMKRFERLYQAWNLMSLLWLILMFLKHSMLLLTKFNIIPNNNSLSCALCGRIEFYGRDNDFPTFLITVHSFYRLSCSLSKLTRRDYYFNWLEFLFSEENHRRKVRNSASMDSTNRKENLYLTKAERILADKSGSKILRTDDEPTSSDSCNFGRYNTDSEALRKMRAKAAFLSSFVISSIVITIFVLTILQLPLVLTWEGIERRYSLCISYLTSNETDIDQLTFGSIYRSLYLRSSSTFGEREDLHSTRGQLYAGSPKSVGPIRSLKLVEFNRYQVGRIIIELLESTFFIHDLLSTILSPSFLLAMCMEETLTYYNKMLKQIDKVVNELRMQDVAAHNPMNSSMIDRDWRLTYVQPLLYTTRNLETAGKRTGQTRPPNHIYSLRRRKPRHTPYMSPLDRRKLVRNHEYEGGFHHEIYLLQLKISDAITMIASYNGYVGIYVQRNLLGWSIYTIFVAGWMLQPADLFGSYKLDCYSGHIIASVLTTIGLVEFAKIRRRSLELYTRMAYCMALENQCLESKVRWSKLMRLYHPIPMNCFRLFKRTELSLFFGLKVIAWIFSALFLSLTFYNYFI